MSVNAMKSIAKFGLIASMLSQDHKKSDLFSFCWSMKIFMLHYL